MATPSFHSSTESLENAMRTELAGVRGRALTEDLRTHLGWMLDSLARSPEWPPDKRGRWVGFVASMLDGEDGMARAQVVATLLGPPPPLPVPHERLLANACTDALMSLALRASEEQHQSLAPFIRACWFSPNASTGSFWLGYLQAAMVRRGLINVQDERERTRGIYHDAYLACGWVPPPSAEPPKANRPKP